jgi:putative CocE/NonD family hydrolase
MGPWTHGGGREQGELVYPENAVDNFSFAMFSDMVEQYTMDNGDNFDEWPTVIYYVMGDVDNSSALGNVWLTSTDWPISYDPVSVYLTTDKKLRDNIPDSSGSFTYEYNPINPVPTVGGQNLNIARGPYDQRLVENRDDVLVFTSEILSDPVWISGPVRARLFVSSDCYDTDFTMKLTDVYPDGRSMLITDGIIRMRNRNGVDHWEFMEPGEIYEVEIDLWSTSYLFNSDHQIRISVSSSNAPRFLANPNTKDAMRQNETYNIAENTLFVGETHPSQIILPVVNLNYEEELNRSTIELTTLRKDFLKRNTLYGIVNSLIN